MQLEVRIKLMDNCVFRSILLKVLIGLPTNFGEITGKISLQINLEISQIV
jgi:hypothetical protein